MDEQMVLQALFDANTEIVRLNGEKIRLNEENKQFKDTLEYILHALTHSEFVASGDQHYANSLATYIRKRLPNK